MTPSAATDAVLCEQPLRITFNPNVIDTTEVTPSLDPFDPIVGGTSCTIEFDVYLKGSGSASVAPEWGEMLEACGFLETDSAVVNVEVLGVGGSTTSALLGATASAVAQTYRGRPITFSGNMTETSMIWDYSAAKLALLTDTMSIVPTGPGTSYTLPRTWVYKPKSTGIESGTMWIYTDGIRYEFAGCRGTCPLTLTSGGPGRISFRFQGMFTQKTDAALPAAVYDASRPPIWKGGSFSINALETAGQTFSIDPGNNLVMPDNPNSAESFDPAIITARMCRGNINPKETTVAVRNAMLDFRNSVKRPLQTRLGTTAGNRIGIVVPSALYLNQGPTDTNGYVTVDIPFHATGQDSGYTIAVF